MVSRIMRELEEERQTEHKVYMVCLKEWEERYRTFMKYMETVSGIRVCPVIPETWRESGEIKLLQEFSSCAGLLCHSDTKPENLDAAVSVFPVISRDMAAKAALCIGDTYETSWLLSCIESGTQAILLRSGLPRFSGKEPKPYQEQILSYYRRLLEYGVRIEDESGCKEVLKEYFYKDSSKGDARQKTKTMVQDVPSVLLSGSLERKEDIPREDSRESRKKQVITSSNIEQLTSNGILMLQKGDIVTDLARERAQFLNIALKYKG